MNALVKWRENRPEGALTQAQLGGLVGVSGAQISRYENGRQLIPLWHIATISKITGIPKHELRPDVFDNPNDIAA